ncbi:hypothetical protein QR680_002125 [Steinernema hermaphroditum]|uniref:Uncharacterized protein n=1 Tax=Steinernema hermaphroditum TaxID=289476 RepID=A0AA39LHM8_9BILA|nr:hypothetical protein QR680_002125 [Steinernema hermaphroditum]
MSRLSIIDLADHAGILSLNPSDLVFEASQLGIQYYDFVLSAATTSDNGYQLYLVKFDTHTNVEWLETARVGPEIVKNNGIPDNDLSMMTLGILIWKHKIARSRVLCLVRSMGTDSSQALEALKRATNKFKCLHHVLTISERRNSYTSVNSRCRSPHDGMRLRVMMCQTRSTVELLPAQAIRETRCLLVPSSNPILCLCFPLS